MGDQQVDQYIHEGEPPPQGEESQKEQRAYMKNNWIILTQLRGKKRHIQEAQ